MIPVNAAKRIFCPFIAAGCLIGLVLLICPLVSAAEKPADPDQMYGFANYSYEHGDYVTAVVEFKRFLFFYPDDRRADAAAFKIGMANLHERRYNKAVEAFENVQNNYPESRFAPEATFMLSRTYLRMDDHQSALAQLQRLLQPVTPVNLRDRALYRIGWIHLQSGEPAAARAAFTAVSDENQLHYNIKEIVQRLDRPKTLPHKNPLTAGLYGIIPGGGYLYTGRFQDALIAFFVNIGLGAAAYESFDNDLYAMGTLFSLVSLGFYSGSIYGGVNAAHKHNQRVYDQFVEELETEMGNHLSFQIQPTPQSILFSLNYSF